MYRGRSVGVVVPAFNEEHQIDRVLKSMPDIVDRVIVVDDHSTDGTAERCEAWIKRRRGKVVLVRHERNTGPGGAVMSGYRAAACEELDIVATMDGDGQMDPDELTKILEPIACDEADYCKGNRLFSELAWQKTPKMRYLGNAFLSLMTKIASGYWHIADSQSGFTAIRTSALKHLDLDAVYPRYGYLNDILIRLNVASVRVAGVAITPVYGIGERSKMNVWKVAPRISLLLWRGFIYRMVHKYVIRDFHPLVFFYSVGAFLLWLGFLTGGLETYYKYTRGHLDIATIVLVALLTVSGIQLVLFAMWFDMEYNRQNRQ